MTANNGMNDDLLPKDLTSAVKDIKLAILQARNHAARASNEEALKLYFFVGGYISKKTRNAKWGTGAIDALSERLQVELPGLRGFSASNIKRMRTFFESWVDDAEIRPLALGELPQELLPTSNGLTAFAKPSSHEAKAQCTVNRPTALGEIESEDAIPAFLTVGFSHHCSILEKTKSQEERWYYIFSAAKGNWSHSELLDHLRADDYHHIGALPNNFEKTLSPMEQATKKASRKGGE